MKSLRAHFDGKVLVPDGPVDLPTGRPLQVYIVSVGSAPSEPVPGSPAALLKGLREDPHIGAEAAEELDRAIAEGKVAVRDAHVFEE